MELSSPRPLGHPARFEHAHRLTVRALEVLDRSGARPVRVRGLEPLNFVAASFAQQVAQFIVRSHQASVTGNMPGWWSSASLEWCSGERPRRPPPHPFVPRPATGCAVANRSTVREASTRSGESLRAHRSRAGSVAMGSDSGGFRRQLTDRLKPPSARLGGQSVLRRRYAEATPWPRVDTSTRPSMSSLRKVIVHSPPVSSELSMT